MSPGRVRCLCRENMRNALQSWYTDENDSGWISLDSVEIERVKLSLWGKEQKKQAMVLPFMLRFSAVLVVVADTIVEAESRSQGSTGTDSKENQRPQKYIHVGQSNAMETNLCDATLIPVGFWSLQAGKVRFLLGATRWAVNKRRIQCILSSAAHILLLSSPWPIPCNCSIMQCRPHQQCINLHVIQKRANSFNNRTHMQVLLKVFHSLQNALYFPWHPACLQNEGSRGAMTRKRSQTLHCSTSQHDGMDWLDRRHLAQCSSEFSTSRDQYAERQDFPSECRSHWLQMFTVCFVFSRLGLARFRVQSHDDRSPAPSI